MNTINNEYVCAIMNKALDTDFTEQELILHYNNKLINDFDYLLDVFAKVKDTHRFTDNETLLVLSLLYSGDLDTEEYKLFTIFKELKKKLLKVNRLYN